jgi:TNF receptor-associated factor 2
MNSNISYHLNLLHDYSKSKFCFFEEKLKHLDESLVVSEKQSYNLITNSLNNQFNRSLDLNGSVYQESTTSDTNQIQKIDNKLHSLQNNHLNLVNDIERVVKSSDKLRLQNKILKENVCECKNTVQELHKMLTLTQISLFSIEERVINQERASFDGTLLWKISNISERMQEAKSGQQTSFYSPPFYTSKNGYKMCARIYLNGDGSGLNTHLSIFFVLLRGENDALLRWPFRQRVTFVLIDQTTSERKQNVLDAFRPDQSSSSFRRPVSDMNIASGLPLFCPHSKLMAHDREYIKEDTIFIKIIVETKDLLEI